MAIDYVDAPPRLLSAQSCPEVEICIPAFEILYGEDPNYLYQTIPSARELSQLIVLRNIYRHSCGIVVEIPSASPCNSRTGPGHQLHLGVLHSCLPDPHVPSCRNPTHCRKNPSRKSQLRRQGHHSDLVCSTITADKRNREIENLLKYIMPRGDPRRRAWRIHLHPGNNQTYLLRSTCYRYSEMDLYPRFPNVQFPCYDALKLLIPCLA